MEKIVLILEVSERRNLAYTRSQVRKFYGDNTLLFDKAELYTVAEIRDVNKTVKLGEKLESLPK